MKATITQIDRGFETELSDARLEQFCGFFCDDSRVQEFVHRIHAEDGAIDLKRGEFYPELLRANLTLRQAVAKAYGIEPQQVQPNYGSNGSIDTVLAAVRTEEAKRLERWAREMTFLTAGTPAPTAPGMGGVVLAVPTYFRNYNSAQAKGLAVHTVPLRKDFQIDVPRLIQKVREVRPSLLMVVTPNNPTGMPIPDDQLLELVEEVPKGTWTMIDRTLVNIEPEISSRDLLARWRDRDVVILHSFSKYLSMSHLRIGVALYSNAEMARVVQPHLPLGIALEGCIKAARIVRQAGGIFPSAAVCENVETNRRLLREFVQHHPELQITDFTGNYCLFLLPPGFASGEFADALQRRGLFVMAGAELPEELGSAVRLHTGGPPEYIRDFCVQTAALLKAR